MMPILLLILVAVHVAPGGIDITIDGVDQFVTGHLITQSKVDSKWGSYITKKKLLFLRAFDVSDDVFAIFSCTPVNEKFYIVSFNAPATPPARDDLNPSKRSPQNVKVSEFIDKVNIAVEEMGKISRFVTGIPIDQAIRVVAGSG